MKVHSKERPHVCEICGKSFKTNRHLVRHRITHSDVKPLSCEFCGKGFASSYNLKSHLRIHTGENPYKCDVCEAKFTQNISLKMHKRSAHGIDMWKGQKPPGSQEVDNINVNDPELYKPQKLIDESGIETPKIHGPECSSRSPDLALESTSCIEGSNKKESKREDQSGLSPDSYVSIPIRPPLNSTPRMQLMQGSLAQNAVPNFPPIANNPWLYLPFVGFPEIADNDNQNIQPALAHSTQVSTPISVHGPVGGSAQSAVLDTSRSFVGDANNSVPSTQRQRTGNKWPKGATTGRQFTDL